jgi:mannosyltransferase OCH1-like enzyme
MNTICSLSSEAIQKIKQKTTNQTPKKYIPNYDPTKPQIIPLHIYQTWHNINEMPLAVKESIQTLKKQNPEFEHHLYDEKQCRTYIQDNFPTRVVNAYDKLIPYALKADLWRYCIIYKNGGIYLDSKYYGIDGFKFIHIIDKEHFCKDIPLSYDAIYNAILICKPNNSIIKKSLDQFVKNIENNYYGSYILCIGPLMMRQFFNNKEYNALNLRHVWEKQKNKTNKFICYNNYRILKYHSSYKMTKKHWTHQWKNKTIYA